MPVVLKGADDLRARMRAIATTFKPVGRKWADNTSRAGKPMVPIRTGRLRKSLRRREANMKRATVVGHFTAYFVDAGTKRHAIVPKKSGRLAFTDQGRTVFAKKVDHPGSRPQPFRKRAAAEGMRQTDMPAELIALWNSKRPAR